MLLNKKNRSRKQLTHNKLTFNSSSDANLSSEAVKTRAIPSLKKEKMYIIIFLNYENKQL